MRYAPSIIRRTLSPSAVALVGASDRSPFAVRLFENLTLRGYAGELVLINARRDVVFGRPAYPRLVDAPSVDVAIISLPREAVEEAVDDAISAGVAGIVLMAVGFRDSGEPEWIRAERRIARKARSAGVILVGPNGLGAVFAPARLGALGAPVTWDMSRDGRIALAMQSGALLDSAVRCLVDMDAPVAYAVSTGNATGTSLGEWAQILIALDDVAVVGLLIEELGTDWSDLAAAAAAAAEAGKQLVVMKMGRSAAGRAVAASHTGSMSGEYEVFRAGLEQIGAAEATSYGAFLGALALRARFGEAGAAGLAVLSPTGGTNGIVADLAQELGACVRPPAPVTDAQIRDLPDFTGLTNPLDLNARWSFTPEGERAGVDLLLGDATIGAALFGVPLLPSDDFLPMLEQIARICEAATRHGKPVILTEVGYGAVSTGLREMLETSPAAIRIPSARDALEAFVLWTKQCPVPPAALDEPAESGRQWSSEEALKRTLRGLLAGEQRITVPSSRLLPRPWDAALSAEDVASPAYLKVVAPEVMHKSKLGLMAGPVSGAAAVAAGSHLAERVDELGIEAEGLLIEESAPAGKDIIVGLTRQPFGLAVMLAEGGVQVEQTGRPLFAMLPAPEGRIRELAAAVLGREPDDAAVAAVERVADALKTLAVEHDLTSVECNPVRVTPNGEVWILDALATVTRAEPSATESDPMQAEEAVTA
ncbi:acetate--CoA ligase family protein [Microbacterium sp. SORGH_AS_0888]|uniref:acetate--CoA ligase family protein n=1 Tax=Microbacterium sp. SORGH_AS_0888 TaxID=3041791 RepID=UPI0027892E46|nr:acetate--CoA ligase family protein [Microbacterium sp. SORGH_AS_0888]MDQ1131001.1 acyl-CoA synthetase (NDP forming) [Microbacterium sp. SORGH_AS_0888]